MQLTEPDGASQPAASANPLEKLTDSARGWHTIQVAVLGFIGICGILRTASSPAPRAVQVLAAVLAVAALATACTAVFIVGRIAYPVGAATHDIRADQGVAHAATQLSVGIRLTIAALILAVIATLAGWWPATATASKVGSAAAPSSVTGPCLGPAADHCAGRARSIRTSNGVVTWP
jgi:hypothetical protein